MSHPFSYCWHDECAILTRGAMASLRLGRGVRHERAANARDLGAQGDGACRQCQILLATLVYVAHVFDQVSSVPSPTQGHLATTRDPDPFTAQSDSPVSELRPRTQGPISLCLWFCLTRFSAFGLPQSLVFPAPSTGLGLRPFKIQGQGTKLVGPDDSCDCQQLASGTAGSYKRKEK